MHSHGDASSAWSSEQQACHSIASTSHVVVQHSVLVGAQGHYWGAHIGHMGALVVHPYFTVFYFFARRRSFSVFYAGGTKFRRGH